MICARLHGSDYSGIGVCSMIFGETWDNLATPESNERHTIIATGGLLGMSMYDHQEIVLGANASGIEQA